MNLWKFAPMAKGALTSIPVLNDWRRRRASTGGSDSSRYCYSVWLRHLVVLASYGFRIKHAHVGELGPGDSVGIGVAALLSGAATYVGLDIVPFAVASDTERIVDELAQLYSVKAPVPDNDEFPSVRPVLSNYEYPEHLVVDAEGMANRISTIRTELRAGYSNGRRMRYEAPWTSRDVITPASLDLILSQAVLEHVDDIDGTYGAMYAWLRRGGYASHAIDFSSHQLSPFWNGHWAYSDWQWKLVRGRREYLLNREPLSTHLRSARSAGFDILTVNAFHRQGALERHHLAARFQQLDSSDIGICGATVILQRR